MALPITNPTNTKAWQNLKNHFSKMETNSIKELFQNDASRAEKFHLKWNDFLVDFSKNNITSETLELLLQLTEEVQLKKAIEQCFNGELINQTENRAVLHAALRAPKSASYIVDGKNVMDEVYAVKDSMAKFTHEITSGVRKGYTGKAFTDVVNIGIGGSDLGPAMVVEALQYYKNHLNVHFVSNVDGDHVNEIIKKPHEGKVAISQIERQAMLNSLKASLAKMDKP